MWAPHDAGVQAASGWQTGGRQVGVQPGHRDGALGCHIRREKEKSDVPSCWAGAPLLLKEGMERDVLGIVGRMVHCWHVALG